MKKVIIGVMDGAFAFKRREKDKAKKTRKYMSDIVLEIIQDIPNFVWVSHVSSTRATVASFAP